MTKQRAVKKRVNRTIFPRDPRQFKGGFGARWHSAKQYPAPPKEVWDEIKKEPKK